MIRLSPTAIQLGESDLRDFLQRESQRRVEAQLKKLEKLSVDSEDEISEPFQPKSRRHLLTHATQERRGDWPTRLPSISSNLNSPPRKASIAVQVEYIENTVASPPRHDFNDNDSLEDLTDGEHEQRSSRRLNHGNDPLEPVANSPEKEDDFHYGGFIGSPSQINDSVASSSFGELL